MRWSTHLIQRADLRIIELLPRPYICKSCQRRRANLPATNPARHASSFADRFRGKLWKGAQPDRKDLHNSPFSKRPIPEGGQDAVAWREAGEARDPKPESDAPPKATTVEPAATWDGLEFVGSSGHWREAPETGDDKVAGFTRIVRPQKLQTRQEFVAVAFQAAVELLSAQKDRMSLNNPSEVLAHDDETTKAIRNTRITAPRPGSFDIVYPDEDSKTLILKTLEYEELPTEENDSLQPDQALEAEGSAEKAGTEPEIAETQEAKTSDTPIGYPVAEDPYPDTERSATEALETQESETDEVEEFPPDLDEQNFQPEIIDPSLTEPELAILLSIPLTDRKFRFFFLKRISQLSGHLFPDPVLPSLRTVNDVINYLDRESKPKAKKVWDHLIQKEELLGLPNVRIEGRRQTPVDREREVGRLKVIEKELERMGLPAYGRKQL